MVGKVFTICKLKFFTKVAVLLNDSFLYLGTRKKSFTDCSIIVQPQMVYYWIPLLMFGTPFWTNVGFCLENTVIPTDSFKNTL